MNITMKVKLFPLEVDAIIKDALMARFPNVDNIKVSYDGHTDGLSLEADLELIGVPILKEETDQ